MRLIIGGAGAGKRDYALTLPGYSNAVVTDGDSCSLKEPPAVEILSHFHLLMRRLLEAKTDWQPWLEALLANSGDCIVLSDEIGCGIVPINEQERRWREETGRALCFLAARAKKVERVICSLVQTLKE